MKRTMIDTTNMEFSEKVVSIKLRADVTCVSQLW